MKQISIKVPEWVDEELVMLQMERRLVLKVKKEN